MKYSKTFVETINKLIILIFSLFIFGCGGASESESNYGPASNTNQPDSAPNPDVSFIAWISPSGSEIEFKDSADIFTVYISTDKDCAENYNSCPNIEKFNIGKDSRSVQYDSLNLSNSAYISLVDSQNNGTYFGEISADTPQSDRFTPRYGFQVTLLNNKLFLIGGYYGGDYKNDVWTSSDGSNWELLTDDGEFLGRSGHHLITVGDIMYLSGGSDNTVATSEDQQFNVVLSSGDGLKWTTVTSNAPYGMRRGHRMVHYRDSLFLIGGETIGHDATNEVWKFVDSEWTQIREHTANDNTTLDFLNQHEALVFKDKIYSIATSDSFGQKSNKVWFTTDGASWQEAVHSNGTKFSGRNAHQVVEFRNELYLIGGKVSGLGGQLEVYDDIWKSVDGSNWEKIAEETPLGKRLGHQAVVLEDKIYVIGGEIQTGVIQDQVFTAAVNDVQRSEDGINWFKGFSGKLNLVK